MYSLQFRRKRSGSLQSSAHRSHLDISGVAVSVMQTLNSDYGVSKLQNFYYGVSKPYCSCSQLSALCPSGCHHLLSHSFSIFPFLPLSHSPGAVIQAHK